MSTYRRRLRGRYWQRLWDNPFCRHFILQIRDRLLHNLLPAAVLIVIVFIFAGAAVIILLGDVAGEGEQLRLEWICRNLKMIKL